MESDKDAAYHTSVTAYIKKYAYEIKNASIISDESLYNLVCGMAGDIVKTKHDPAIVGFCRSVVLYLLLHSSLSIYLRDHFLHGGRVLNRMMEILDLSPTAEGKNCLSLAVEVRAQMNNPLSTELIVVLRKTTVKVGERNMLLEMPFIVTAYNEMSASVNGFDVSCKGIIQEVKEVPITSIVYVKDIMSGPRALKMIGDALLEGKKEGISFEALIAQSENYGTEHPEETTRFNDISSLLMFTEFLYNFIRAF